MYNSVYSYKFKTMITSESMLKDTHYLNTSYWYADSVSYDSSTGKYSLVNPYRVSSTSEYVSLKGKYTFNSSNETYTNSTVYYIGGISYSTYYGISLSDGNTIEYYDDAYTYGTSYTKNEDGTYTINEPSTIQKTTYYDNYTDLKGKYVCKNAVNNSCDTLWYVSYSYISDFIWITSENEYKYAKGFTYTDGKYVLDYESVMVWNFIDSSELEKLNNAHYTCFNTTGECNTVYYVYYLDNDKLYYIELQNGIGVGEALQEMLSADNVNKTNSTIKDIIDTWYANNMTSYTKYLEDAVFCNDRSISNYGGWNYDGGSIKTDNDLLFNNFKITNNLYCTNLTDRFSVANEKAKLTYPVGLVSAPEMQLLGNSNVRLASLPYWFISPSRYEHFQSRINIYNSSGEYYVTDFSGIRPAISLMPGTRYATGAGSTTDPYIVDLNAPTITLETLIDGEREKYIRIIINDDTVLSSNNQYKYYLSISETEPLGGEWKDYVPGEMIALIGENQTRYLWIYPVMDKAGNINDNNVDVNSPYVVSSYIFKDLSHYLYDVIKKEVASGSGLAKLYDGQHNDTYNETGTENIYYFYGADDTAATSVLNKNNVVFAGFCWQMIRTTDTGGTKLIYNGVPKEVDGKKVCTNSGIYQQIEETSEFNENYDSLAYVGYMYNAVYSLKKKSISSSEVYKYANSFTYSNGTYKLSSDAISIDITNLTEILKLNNAHYTCFNTTGECNTIYYIYYSSSSDAYYIELKDGKSVEDALNEMLSADNVNQTNSTIKDTVDTWYANNMTSYTKYLEDTVFCNDRSILDYGAWNPNGGDMFSNYLSFKNFNITNDLYCTNVTDRFSVGNEKARLAYPVGLMSAPEMYLLGNNSIRETGDGYWLASPYAFRYLNIFEWGVNSDGYVEIGAVAGSNCVRPAISLAPGTKYVAGTGSATDPYVILTN